MTHQTPEAVADTTAELLRQTIHEALRATVHAGTTTSRWMHTAYPIGSPEETALRALARQANAHELAAVQLMWDAFYLVTGGHPFGAKSRQHKVDEKSPVPDARV